MKGRGLEATIVRILREARASKHRRLIVAEGSKAEWVAARCVDAFKAVNKSKPSVLFTYYGGGEARSRVRFLDELDRGSVGSLKFVPYEETESVMGQTFNILVMDVSENMRPNDLGRLVETVSGGGVIVMLTPSLDDIVSGVKAFHRRLVVHPYREEDLRHLFERRLVRKLMEHEGIWVLRPPEVRYGKPLPVKTPRRLRPKVPRKTRFPKKLYKVAATEDQVRALQKLETLLEGGRRVVVITANRGRGKSAILGVASAGFVRAGVRDIVVTAPSKANVSTLFEFAAKSLRRMGLEAEVKGSAIRSGDAEIRFVSPYKALSERPQILIVDEAAGIPVPMLHAMLKTSSKAVFSSTIHGYEGIGRGFGLRFMSTLRSMKKIALEEVELREPIRYAPGDPIERWLYDALLLDAEPPEFDEEEAGSLEPGACEYFRPDLEEWFTSRDDMLRQFIGTYVLAHYRNRPDDLAILGDAPHHSARVLLTPSGKVVVALHVADEGRVSEEDLRETLAGRPPSGNLVPLCVVRHYPNLLEFAHLRGLRVVRIATNPEMMRRGFGSHILGKLCEEAEEAGLDWVGAGFGGSPELLRFWTRNGFIPIHISPGRNPTSGEFSVVVVKPITRRAEEIVLKVNLEFRTRLVEALCDPYYTLEPEVAYHLLRGWGEHDEPLNLTESQVHRLMAYAKGTMTYEGASDSIKGLLRKHFLSSGEHRMPLSEKAETALISRCLQARSWSTAAKGLRLPRYKLIDLVRDTVRSMVEFYIQPRG